MARARLVLIDGDGLMAGAWRTLPRTLRSPAGTPTQVAHALAAALARRVLADPPEAAAVLLGPTPGPEGLRAQRPHVDLVARAFGVEVVRVPGPALAAARALARRAADAGWAVRLLSPDPVAHAAIGPGVRVEDPLRGHVFDEAAARDARLGAADAVRAARAALAPADGAGLPEPSSLALRPTDPASRAAGIAALGLSGAFSGAAVASLDVRVVEDAAAAEALLADLRGAVGVVGLWEGAPPGRGKLLGLALAGDGGVAGYAPVGPGLDALGPWLADPSWPKAVADLRELLTALWPAGFELDGVVGDLAAASHLLDPSARLPHRRDQVVAHALGEASPEAVGAEARDAGRAADQVARAWAAIEPHLDEAGLADALDARELPLARVLAAMQCDGVAVDAAALAALDARWSFDLARLAAEAHAAAGRAFDPGSPRQVAALLYDALGLPAPGRGRGGRTTDAEALDALGDAHPVVPAIAAWRATRHLLDHAVRPLRRAIDPDGRVRPTWSATASATGRIVASEPDLHRTPARGEAGRAVRAAFVGREGWPLLSADWSQVELRLLAHASGDPALGGALRAGRDVHRETAAELFGLAPEAVDEARRQVGKAVIFGILYGQGAASLGRALGRPRDEAEALIARTLARYAGVRDWLERVAREAAARGEVRTLLGRRRRIPELASPDRETRAYGARAAANTAIQGSTADLCRVAMVRLAEGLVREGLRARLVLQMHDELVLEVPPDELGAARRVTTRAMTGPWPLDLALEVRIGVGPTWAEAHG